ncbi:MAG: signal peptide peptidase SppA [Deltaproteobacteria bacterium]|nr:signal peptide peptidase SppA [Deltaproteobacteria bacterium]MBW2016978.1 signal peptide peptidase SppA [Deltaproteobacteria bacterium]MBW2130712.1 signal peptide peptidase SppA [Deltaproteobacteria bacterium]MBW2303708.1 signal peptide peptidase SppA [Deltaproteobacteria bacterium]
MAEKRHPVLIALLILGFVTLFLGGVMILVMRFSGPPAALSFGPKIGVIPIQGAILDPEPVLTQLIEFRKEKQIKAIILRINSPGGGVAPSQEIYREVRRTRKTKKVIASMGSMAASGGYYVASAADKIVANPGTLTGSIGVIMEFLNVKELLEKFGVGMEVIKSGEFKDIGSPHRKLTEREKALLQGLIAEIQEQFVTAVAEGRGISKKKIREIADGRVLSGEKAKALGLVDALGNFRDAVELAKRECGIKGEVSLVYPRKPRKKLWEVFLEDTSKLVEQAIRNAFSSRIEFNRFALSY